MDALASLAEAVDACYYLGDAAAAVATADTIERLLAETESDPDARARAAIAAGCARVLAGQGRRPADPDAGWSGWRSQTPEVNPPWPPGR